MNKKISELVSYELNSFQPSTEIVSRALRHLSENKRKQLLSKKMHSKRSAIGKLYEYVIYERLSELSGRNTCFNVIGKGADIPSKMKKAPELKQDGLYYDRSGDIVARGNGQELAEFDMILTSKMNEIVFVEIKNSKNIPKDFDQLISYKKRLLSHLFNQPVSFVLISSFDIRNNPSVTPTISTKNDHFVKTCSREDFCKIIKSVIMTRPFIPKERNSNQLLSDFKTTQINYKKIHNLCRKKVIKALLNGKPVNFGGNSWLIKRLVMGKLSNDSVMELRNKKEIIGQEKKLDLKNYHRLFSKIVLSLSIPDLRPVLYMKAVEKSLYLKMGPLTPLIFGFERNIFPRTAFYNWLDNIQHELNPNLLNQIMTKCLNTKTCGSRRKAGEIPGITW